MQQEVAGGKKKKKHNLKYGIHGIQRASGLVNKWRCQGVVHLERAQRFCAPPLYFALHFYLAVPELHPFMKKMVI